MLSRQNLKKWMFFAVVIVLAGVCVESVDALTPISNCTGLQNMQSNLTEDYYLTQDINCSDTINWNSGAGFVPIGCGYDNCGSRPINQEFTGNFDGQNYTITGLFINRGGDDYVGLFGYTDTGSNIMNVGLKNINITGSQLVGGLVGYNKGQITNSYVTGNVSGGNYFVGGLVGKNYYGTVNNSYSTGSVTGTFDNVGGLVGENGYGTISNSYSAGSVSGSNSYIGGLVGHNNGGNISNSYSTGSVSGGWAVGGLVGRNGGEIINSYATGSASGSGGHVGGLVGYNYGIVNTSYSTGSVSGGGDYVGGLVGDNYESSISNSYSTGSVSGNYSVGGLVGRNIYSTINNSYYNNYTGNPDVSVGDDSGTTDCTAIQDNEAYFYNISNAPMASWDFINIWDDVYDLIGFPASAWSVLPPLGYGTLIGSPTNWKWTTTPLVSSYVKSGSPTNWQWLPSNPGSGRKVPQGTLTSWSWIDE